MSDRDGTRAAPESTQRAGAASHPTRFGEVIHRYLGAAGYPEIRRPAHRPSRPTPPAPRFTGLVLVGVDDAPDSHVAVDHAAIEAELHGWDLRLLHVPTGGAAGDPGARLLEQMTERVYARSRTVAVTSRLAVGTPEAMLLAEAGRADLVVVGGRHGAGAAAQHTGPVLVVRVPGWPPGSEFAQRPILAGVDGPGTPAVDFALDEARVRRCDVVLLHAAPSRDRRESLHGVTVHHRIHRSDPIAALVEASDHAAAVVIGRGQAADARPGSVGRSVLPHARCPVFLVG